MTLVSRSFLNNSDFPQSQPLVDGRVLRVSLLKDGREVVLYNIHNFGLAQHQLADLSHVLAQDVDTAMEVPNELSVLVGGDFNFLPNGESSLVLDAPTLVQPPGDRLPLGLLLRGQLERLLRYSIACPRISPLRIQPSQGLADSTQPSPLGTWSCPKHDAVRGSVPSGPIKLVSVVMLFCSSHLLGFLRCLWKLVQFLGLCSAHFC